MEKVKIFILALLVTAGTQVFANNDIEPEIEILSTAPNSFKLVYKSAEATSVKINIYNEKSNRIFSDKVNNPGSFSKLYNFKNLNSGKYTFEIIANGQSAKEDVYYTLPKKASNKMKAFVNQLDNNKKFKLMVMGNNMEPVTVKIYDVNNRLLHERSYTSEKSIGEVYNLKNVNVNEVQFVITSGDEVLKTEAFNI